MPEISTFYKWLSTAEATQAIGKSRQTLYMWRRNNRVVARRIGHKWYYLFEYCKVANSSEVLIVPVQPNNE